MSSALALFSASRILHRVLEDLYPSPAGYEISLSTVHSLAENLDEWLKNLPAHLQLTFLLDKPNASVASSRSILLVSCNRATSQRRWLVVIERARRS